VDPDLGSGIQCLFDPWILDPGWVQIRIRDEQPGSYFRELRHNFWIKILKFVDADPGYDIRDRQNLDTGSGMEKIHPGSATLLFKRADGFRIIERLIIMRQQNLSHLERTLQICT
jgi:hypothetical protein